MGFLFKAKVAKLNAMRMHCGSAIDLNGIHDARVAVWRRVMRVHSGGIEMSNVCVSSLCGGWKRGRC